MMDIWQGALGYPPAAMKAATPAMKAATPAAMKAATLAMKAATPAPTAMGAAIDQHLPAAGEWQSSSGLTTCQHAHEFFSESNLLR